MQEYRFERVSAEGYEDMVFLYQSAFGQKIHTSHFKRKFDTHHLGVSHLGFIAYDASNKPAAFYGVYPQQAVYRGAIVLAAQSGDTMTHPNHAGKGLFTQLAKQTYELAKQEGVQFIFGFPNKNSLPGFVRKLCWTRLESMRDYHLKVYTIPCAAATKRIRLLLPFHRLYQKLVAFIFSGKATIFPNSAMSSESVSIYRDIAYMRYKKFGGSYLLRVLGCEMWVRVDGSLLVGDITTECDLKTAMKAVKKLAFWMGCHDVIFSVSRNSYWDKQLQSILQSEEGIYVGYLNLQSTLPLEELKFVAADMDTF